MIQQQILIHCRPLLAPDLSSKAPFHAPRARQWRRFNITA